MPRLDTTSPDADWRSRNREPQVPLSVHLKVLDENKQARASIPEFFRILSDKEKEHSDLVKELETAHAKQVDELTARIAHLQALLMPKLVVSDKAGAVESEAAEEQAVEFEPAEEEAVASEAVGTVDA